MFDLEVFCQEAYAGKKGNSKEVLDYIRNFENLILWGVGNLGQAVSERLLAEQIEISVYWDIAYKERPVYHGISVTEPFKEEFDREKTLVIPCIVNGSLGSYWTEDELKKNGYSFFLPGIALYEGIMCPLNKEYFDIRECTGRKECSLCNCERYVNLLNQKIDMRGALTFQLITFIITTRCTLNCRYCGQRLSEYEERDRKDFTVKDIKRDIEHFLEAVDFVGMISIIGGEPFLHPNIVEIVEYCLTKNNFGVVNITTNGVVKLTKELLQKLKNDRVKISFSVYDTYLTENQKRLLEYNIRLVEQSGINYSLSHPLWVRPCELKDYHHKEEFMENQKLNCDKDKIKMSAAVRNGIFYPCEIAENIESLHKFSAGNAMVDVRKKENLRERLFECLQQKYFDACHYCNREIEEQIVAGEQV